VAQGNSKSTADCRFGVPFLINAKTISHEADAFAFCLLKVA
jgi:hypothetical protein